MPNSAMLALFLLFLPAAASAQCLMVGAPCYDPSQSADIAQQQEAQQRAVQDQLDAQQQELDQLRDRQQGDDFRRATDNYSGDRD